LSRFLFPPPLVSISLMAIRLYAMKIPARFGYASKNNKTEKNIHFICTRDADEPQRRVIHYIFYIYVKGVWMGTCDSVIRVLLRTPSLRPVGLCLPYYYYYMQNVYTYIKTGWLDEAAVEVGTVSHPHHIAFFILYNYSIM